MRCAVAIVSAWIVAGCGRFEFDPMAIDAAPTEDATDAVPGHDEDQDGFADAIDRCPHVAGDLADLDGDGVGDACDPNPAIGSERLLVFSPLTPGTHPFTEIDGWTQQADGLHFAGTGETFAIEGPFTTIRLEIGFTIQALFGIDQHQVASGIEGTSPYYFVELNENLGSKVAAVVSYDPTNGYVTLGSVPHNGMHSGRGLLRLDAITTTSSAPEFRLVAGWLGELYAATGATAAYTGGDRIRLVFNGLDLVVEYVVLIEAR